MKRILQSPAARGAGGKTEVAIPLRKNPAIATRLRWLAASAAALVGLCGFNVVAEAQDSDAGAPLARCEQALPKGTSGGGNEAAGGTDADQGGGAAVDRGGDLSKKLGACGGVLKAPDMNDGGMVTPAPDTGRERVITPGMLPPGSNGKNGTGG